MSRDYPDWIDPWKAAEGRKIFSGSMPLARMDRLAPLLVDTAGEAVFTVHFAFDSQGLVTISVTVEALLSLVCQRSLEPYRAKISRQSVLGAIQNIAEEPMLPENYEPVWVEHRRVALRDLVEDELLLGLPLVPVSPDTAAVEWSTAGEAAVTPLTVAEPVRQPFAELAKQLKKHRAQRGDQ